MIRLACLVLAGVLLVGCEAETHDFLGVPENESRTIDQDNPEIDGRLRGATTVTPVMATDYATYQKLKDDGEVVHEERHGRFVYFAVSDVRHAPLPRAGPDAAMGAYFEVTVRHKAELPE